MRTASTALALTLLAALAAGAGCGQRQGGDETSAAERQILQELAALRDDVDEVKDALAEIQAQRAAVPAAPTAAAPAPRPTHSLAPVQTAGFPFLGRKDAPVTIVEFTDYQCPFCRRHFASTLPKLKTDYVDTGKVRYVLVDNPIPSHRYADEAAEAARCAQDQGKYWEMHDHLFTNQHKIQPDAFAAFAKELGLDEAAFSACMADHRHQSEVQAGARMARATGARGTPSFVLGKSAPDGTVSGDLVVGAKAYALFKDKLDELLAD